MVTRIKNYSTTPASNNLTPPNGFPEGMAISDVNNAMRQNMADLRDWYEDAIWIDFGHAGLSFFDATNFKVTGDKTAIYHVKRRVRAIGTTPFTIYGSITAVAFSSPDTTVTVAWDSGSLNSTLNQVAVSSIRADLKTLHSDAMVFASSLAFVPTGFITPYAGATAPTGYVLASGRTIGNAASGGTERANADTAALFTLLWDAFANTQLPIQDSSGTASTRGANAAADYAANKRLPLPDLRGRAVAGLDNMGGTSANRLTGASGSVDGDVIGASGGTETETAPLPAHTHFTHNSDSGAGNPESPSFTLTASTTATRKNSIADATPYSNYVINGSGTTANVGLTSSAGAGGTHNNIQPTFILPYIIKL
jgi:microcystin-dependent protein